MCLNKKNNSGAKKVNEIIHILYTGCAKIKKKYFRRQKVNVLLYGHWAASRYGRLYPEWKLQALGRRALFRISSARYPSKLFIHQHVSTKATSSHYVALYLTELYACQRTEKGCERDVAGCTCTLRKMQVM